MKRILISTIIIFGVFNTAQLYAQTSGKMKARITYVEKNDKGKITKKMDSREEYNAAGVLIKEIEYNSEGKVKSYVISTYVNNRKEAETKYDSSNKMIEKNVYTYNAAGFRIAKTTYNAANKVTKKRLYSYEYF